ncbi:MAG TPA: molecular chaperone TorD family protein [Acidimicrobiia bacterium]|nr:molecular chaperone TorD family protein [Acidimicrobiia bacterium]
MFTYSLAGLQLDDAQSAPAVPIEENETTARSAVYQVLGRLVTPPDVDHFEKAGDGRWAKELAEAAELLPFSVELADPGLGDDVTVGQYQEAFEAVTGGDKLRASVNVQSGLDEVARFYEYFGLGVAEGGLASDHLATECDFLQFVTYKEAAAQSPRLQTSFRRAQLDFLERHLRLWVPTLAAAVAAADTLPFFAWTIDLVERFTAADHAYLQSLG